METVTIYSSSLHFAWYTHTVSLLLLGVKLCPSYRLMENAKMLGDKLNEANKAVITVQRQFAQVNIEFRTMDKDINTVRPLLMKLQREKEQLTR